MSQPYPPEYLLEYAPERPAESAPEHAAERSGPRWARRNRRGLVALLPALLLACGYPGYDVYQGIRSRNPGEAIASATPGGPVTYRGYRIRLAGLVPMPAPVDGQGHPLRLARGVTAWRARVEFEAIGVPPANDALNTCEIQAVDRLGRTFGSSPAELLRIADLPSSYCDAGRSGDPTRFAVPALFALPGGERPTAVRILWQQDLPRYLELTPG